ncbi:MAG: hypothetical protein ABI587_14060 [Gemmatimonadales bacterium]
MEDFQLRLLIENIATIVAILMILGFVALGPVGRAIARRIEGKPAEADVVDELRERLAELERTQSQTAELAERLDFAERMLAQRAEASQLRSEN